MKQYSARFEIQTMRCFYLKYFLNQEEDSLLRKVFNIQLNQMLKGDWATNILEELKEWRFAESLDEIKKMAENKFKNKIIKENAEYLIGKHRRKGKTIKYTSIQVSKCLNIFT